MRREDARARRGTIVTRTEGRTMPRTRHLIVAAVCVVALVAVWMAGRDVGPPATTPSVATSPAPRTGSVAQRGPRARGSTGESPAESAEKPNAPAKPPARVFVHVVAGEDDSPIAGARLHTIYVDGDSTTDANGDARVDVPMSEKTPDRADTWVEASAPGRVQDSAHVDVVSGGEQRVTLKLNAGFAVDGFVHDAAGRPVAGAHVTVTDASGCCTPYPEVAKADGDADGRFRVDGLPLTSRVGFDVAAPGHARKTFMRRPHETKPLDVTLDAGGVIRGVVRKPDGTPAEDARVIASAVRADDERGVEDVEARSDESGAFAIDTLDLGHRWTLVARDSDFMDSEQSIEIPMSADHAEATRDLTLRPAAHVVLELGFAVPHAPSTAHLNRPWIDDPYCPVPGRKTIVVTSAGTWHVEADVEGLPRQEADAEVGPGETKTVTIRFDEGASIAGVVVDDLGAPVEGASVKSSDTDQSERSASSGADGRFVLNGLRRVERELHVTSPGHGDGDASKVVAPRDDVRIVVPRNGEVVAKLRLPDGATPPEKYAVHCNGAPLLSTDDEPAWSDGRVVRSLPPTKYIVDIDVDGYVRWEKSDVEVVAGGRTDLGEIVLDAGLPLSGRVVDPEGHGVAQIDVFVDNGLKKSDATGHFVWPHLSAGTHELVVTLSPDFLDVTVPVTLTKDTAPLAITLHRGAVLRVRVTGAQAKDDDTINVHVFSANAPDADEAREGIWIDGSLADGFFHRVCAGPTRVEVRKDDETVLATKHVDLHEGEDVEIEIALPK
jgi:hypothetical protein